MNRIDFAGGGAVTISRDNSRPARPLVNVRAHARSGGTVLLFVLPEREVLALVRLLLTGGEPGTAADVAAERDALRRLCGERAVRP